MDTLLDLLGELSCDHYSITVKGQLVSVLIYPGPDQGLYFKYDLYAPPKRAIERAIVAFCRQRKSETDEPKA